MARRAVQLLVVAAVGAAAYVGYDRYVRREATPPPSPDEPVAAPRVDAGPGAVDPTGGRDRVERPPHPALSGGSLEVTLLSPPARYYESLTEDGDADLEYRRIVEGVARAQRHRDVRYSRELSRAAVELAYQSAVLGDHPPEAALAFVLHSGGAPESNAARFYLRTTAEGAEPITETVRRALADQQPGYGPHRVGVGEAETPDETYTRRVVVLVTRRAYEIEPTPRFAGARASWRMRGTLPAGYTGAVATALYPNGRMDGVELDVRGRTFELTAPTGADPGTMMVGIDGVGRDGPGKLLQVAVEVGGDPPRTFVAHVPQPEPAFESIEQAEAYAFELLNADRARFGLPLLEHDPELTRIARAHSEDMRDRDFFGHLSPRTGLASARLAAAGYRASGHGENLARNDSLGESEASLMNSVGHRRNILREDYTHAGVGVAEREAGQRRDWLVTQLFARKVVPIDRDAAVETLVRQLGDARARAGLAPLAWDDGLAAAAADGARAIATAGPDVQLEPIAERVSQRARAHADGTIAVSTHGVSAVDSVETPDAALDGRLTLLGVGVEQSGDSPQGRIGVVIVVAADR